MNLAKGITQLQNRYLNLGLATCSFLIVMGCSNPFELEENKVSFDGYYFSSKLSRNKSDNRSFDLKVRRANRSLIGAREAGRYEATRFCIKNFGTSDVKWILGPDDQSIGLTGKVLKLSGQCDA
tara:strand:+ start:1253 stop:1624 length:372 start_codon:yes stop_codon:yes gene_type:complete